MKPNVPATLLATLVAGIAAASGQTPTPFTNGLTVGPGAETLISTFTNGGGTGTQLYTDSGGLLLYSGTPETSPTYLDGGVTLAGKPISLVLGSDYGATYNTGTFNIWRRDDYWNGGLVAPVFRIDTAANTAAFNGVNVSISGGTLSVAGSPVLTSASAASTYITTVQANTNYPLKTALPNYGIDGTNFDRANGSATFGNSSYALGINNFSSGSSRVGRDNGLSYPGSGTSSNATTPIPFNNFKNNAAFGSSVIGHNFSSWSTDSFKGTERLENNVTTGTAKISVSKGAMVFNSLVTGAGFLQIQPSFYGTTPQSGASVLGNASATVYGNGRFSNALVTGGSTLSIWHETNPSNGTNAATADGASVLGGSQLTMTNQSTTTAPTSDYVTLGGQSRSLALSTRSVNHSTAFGKSMIYSGDYAFGYGIYAPSAYFPGTDRWTSVFPRVPATFGFAAGESVVANGSHGTALGKARVYADYGTAIGEGVDAGTAGTSVTGRFNKLQQYTYASTEEGTMQQFVVGNGTGDADADRSNALVVERAGLTTLTNKSWKANVTANPGEELADPPSPTNNDRGGDALLVEGHTRLKGKILIQPQGDLSMDGFSGGELP